MNKIVKMWNIIYSMLYFEKNCISKAVLLFLLIIIPINVAARDKNNGAATNKHVNNSSGSKIYRLEDNSSKKQAQKERKTTAIEDVKEVQRDIMKTRQEIRAIKSDINREIRDFRR